MPRRIIAYDHSLKTRGLRWNEVYLVQLWSKCFTKPHSIEKHDTSRWNLSSTRIILFQLVCSLGFVKIITEKSIEQSKAVQKRTASYIPYWVYLAFNQAILLPWAENAYSIRIRTPDFGTNSHAQSHHLNMHHYLNMHAQLACWS